MRDEEQKKVVRFNEKSDDSEEYGDEVDSLPGVRVSNALFDSTLETKDSRSPTPIKSSSPTNK